MDCCQCSCVILNYNDAQTTISLVKQIREYGCIRWIIVVDNRSDETCWIELQTQCRGDKVILLRTDRNGGYGYGNNFGIRYASEVLRQPYVLVVNPDVKFSEACLRGCIRAMMENGAAAVSGIQLDKSGKPVMQCAWDLPSGAGLLFSCEFMLRHSFFPLPRIPYQGNGPMIWVDCVPGSFILLDCNAFWLAGGFDEELFLYYEETVLGYRLKSTGYKTLLLTDQCYVHQHGASVNRSISAPVRRRRVQFDSLIHCLKTVYHWGSVKLFGGRLFLKLCLAEEWILSILKTDD